MTHRRSTKVVQYEGRERLLRPPVRKRASIVTEKRAISNEVSEARARRTAEKTRRDQREQRRRDAVARAKAERDAAFAKPLIDAGLLTASERLETRASVVGRQRWYPMGAARS